MSIDPVLLRFSVHLTENPYVRTASGVKEMLAGRQLSEFDAIELNQILCRYIAIESTADQVPDLMPTPTITVYPRIVPMVHHLWELVEPVTLTADGHPKPIAFFKDTAAAAANCLAVAGKPSLSASVIQGFVWCPLHTSHTVTTHDSRYTLGGLITAFRLQLGHLGRRSGNSMSSANTHYRSGANILEFDALRGFAKEISRSTSGTSELESQLQAWASINLSSSPLKGNPLRDLISRVAAYTYQRRGGAVSQAAGAKIQRAAHEVSTELQLNSYDVVKHMSKVIADRAGVSERIVRRYGKHSNATPPT